MEKNNEFNNKKLSKTKLTKHFNSLIKNNPDF